jgi:hypothetical protein
MDEKANEILYGGIDMPPEMDNYPEEQDKRQLWAIYESSTYAILEHMNKEEFKDTYNILKTDITSMPDEYQKVFIDKYMDKMAEIYEYEFPSKRIYGRPEEIRDMFKFIEFVEFDNLSFFKYVWKYQDDILSVDIRKYVQENEKAIMDEMVQQSTLLNF